MEQSRFCVIVLLISLMVIVLSNTVLADPLRIYLDADMTVARASGVAIERGIRTALSEVDNKLGGIKVELIVLDHRGNSSRSLVNLKQFMSDPNALVLFTGLHSPPLLKHKNFINNNNILTLDPWAAAGPITRSVDKNNWIFRLSIDDTKAGEVITRRAIDSRGFSKPALLLENTGWGKSNLKTMTTSLETRGIAPVSVVRFDWGVTLAGAKIILRNIKKAGADVIFLVANAPEGKTLSKAMYELDASERLPIVSHWGITGGDFPKIITADIRQALDIEFLQTTFSFMDMGTASFPNKVFNSAANLFPEIKKPKDIKAPTGFIHAYDLMRIFITAIEQSGMTGDVEIDRNAIRSALQKLNKPVEGLVKTYSPPFREYTPEDMDAHEALGKDDFTFGRFNEEDAIILVK